MAVTEKIDLEFFEAQLKTLTPSKFGFIFCGSIVLFCVWKVVYRLYFHPLASYPGPKLWAISRLPWNWVNMHGRISWRMRELHDQYGPVVRISHDELSYNTSGAWKKIYGQRKPEFQKALDGRGIAPPSIGGRKSLMTETQERHLLLRKIINPAFSEKALREQEHYIKTHSDTLIAQLRRVCHKVPEDMTHWYNLTAFDIVSDLAFGTPANALNNPDQPWIKVILERAKAIVWFQIATQYGLLGLLSFLTPKYVAESRRQHIARTDAKLKERMSATNPGKDFMSYILDNIVGENLPHVELIMLASNFIVAGSGTSAGGMSGLTYLLLRNPEKLAILCNEIRSRFATQDEITMQATAQCKYLNACIDEGLRLYPPTPGSLPRFVPEGGQEIEGKWIPGGFSVGCNQLACGHSELNFHRAKEFIPERYLELEPGSPFLRDDKAAVQPFSMGQRVCIGRAMAYAEMRMTLAKVIFTFDMELDDPDNDWWYKQGTYLVWEKMPLMVKLRPRQMN